jgi:hypothetical protein
MKIYDAVKSDAFLEGFLRGFLAPIYLFKSFFWKDELEEKNSKHLRELKAFIAQMNTRHSAKSHSLNHTGVVLKLVCENQNNDIRLFTGLLDTQILNKRLNLGFDEKQIEKLIENSIDSQTPFNFPSAPSTFNEAMSNVSALWQDMALRERQSVLEKI